MTFAEKMDLTQKEAKKQKVQQHLWLTRPNFLFLTLFILHLNNNLGWPICHMFSWFYSTITLTKRSILTSSTSYEASDSLNVTRAQGLRSKRSWSASEGIPYNFPDDGLPTHHHHGGLQILPVVVNGLTWYTERVGLVLNVLSNKAG